MPGNQRARRRRKARRRKAAVADVGDFVRVQIVVTVVFGSYDVVKHRPQVLAIHPQ